MSAGYRAVGHVANPKVTGDRAVGVATVGVAPFGVGILVRHSAYPGIDTEPHGETTVDPVVAPAVDPPDDAPTVRGPTNDPATAMEPPSTSARSREPLVRCEVRIDAAMRLRAMVTPD